jgi:protein ImuA
MSPRPAYFAPACERASGDAAKAAFIPLGQAANSPIGSKEFSTLAAQMAASPLHEFCPAEPGAETAALGFGLALAAAWAGPPGLIWAGEQGVFAEDGAPYPVGLAQYGIDPGMLIVVRAHTRDEALWAAEQGLSARDAVVICSLSGRGKPLDLKATRRLLLFAERNGSRCLLVRPLAEASAAWTRWRVAAAPSSADANELGLPAFSVELARSRFGPAGARFTLDWNADARSFVERSPSASDVPKNARQK